MNKCNKKAAGKVAFCVGEQLVALSINKWILWSYPLFLVVVSFFIAGLATTCED